MENSQVSTPRPKHARRRRARPVQPGAPACRRAVTRHLIRSTTGRGSHGRAAWLQATCTRRQSKLAPAGLWALALAGRAASSADPPPGPGSSQISDVDVTSSVATMCVSVKTHPRTYYHTTNRPARPVWIGRNRSNRSLCQNPPAARGLSSAFRRVGRVTPRNRPRPTPILASMPIPPGHASLPDQVSTNGTTERPAARQRPATIGLGEPSPRAPCVQCVGVCV